MQALKLLPYTFKYGSCPVQSTEIAHFKSLSSYLSKCDPSLLPILHFCNVAKSALMAEERCLASPFASLVLAVRVGMFTLASYIAI